MRRAKGISKRFLLHLANLIKGFIFITYNPLSLNWFHIECRVHFKGLTVADGYRLTLEVQRGSTEAEKQS